MKPSEKLAQRNESVGTTDEVIEPVIEKNETTTESMSTGSHPVPNQDDDADVSGATG